MSACYRERHDHTQIQNVRQAELSDWLRLPAPHVILGDMYVSLTRCLTASNNYTGSES